MKHSRVHSLLFWLTVPACLSAAVLVVLRMLAGGGGGAADAGAEAASRLRWLLTDEGERRGFAIVSDLSRDGGAWELWGPDRGKAPLNPIAQLRPGSFFTDAGFGFNGGYWDEHRQPVGVCAGERGIHAARSHGGGFALTAERAWIGPLTARARLISREMRQNGKSAVPAKKGPKAGILRGSAATTTTTGGLELALNPWPLPRRTPYLIDPGAMTGELKTEGAATVAWLEREPGTEGLLRFNTSTGLRVRRTLHHRADEALEASPAGMLLLVIPDVENKDQKEKTRTVESQPASANSLHPVVGGRFRLELTLEPVKGVVRLATCAGPRLLKDGKIAEGLGQDGAESRAERTWRTAVGCDATGRRMVVLMLARGRDGLPGVTLRDTARTLADLGASEALNLDGGSSSCVWYSQLRSELRPLFPLQSEIHHAIFLRKDPAVSTGK